MKDQTLLNEPILQFQAELQLIVSLFNTFYANDYKDISQKINNESDETYILTHCVNKAISTYLQIVDKCFARAECIP
jgi:hypothetical protein